VPDPGALLDEMLALPALDTGPFGGRQRRRTGCREMSASSHSVRWRTTSRGTPHRLLRSRTLSARTSSPAGWAARSTTRCTASTSPRSASGASRDGELPSWRILTGFGGWVRVEALLEACGVGAEGRAFRVSRARCDVLRRQLLRPQAGSR
jgi:hypothetical protein